MKATSYPVFLVDDSEVYLKTLEKYLQEHLSINVHIHTFLSGEDCLKNLSMKPQIIILDYFLDTGSSNSMNGLEVLKKIKKIDPEIIVVMLSKQDDLQVATDFMKYGAFDYVSKNENAFIRVQNAINNIDKQISQSIELKTNRQVKRILIAWIILLIGAAVLMQVFFSRI